jgi:hypothetical protein
MTTMTFIRWLGVSSAILMLTTAGGAAPAETIVKPPVKQTTFATPEAAVAALIAASEPFDTVVLTNILGADGVDLVSTGDGVKDKSQSAAFFAKAREHSEIARDPKDPNVATLLVGTEAWPMPVPLVQYEGKWRFDSAAGREEILFRRIGENELLAIQVCLGYVEAQHDYAAQKRDGASVNQYAQHVISSPGKQDGLAWQAADGTWEGPVGHAIAAMIAEGYTDKMEPFHGYYYKILKSQGPSAPMGEMDFIVKGVMIGGFALVAAPSNYGVTGVKTFIVGPSGIVYEKDLGPETAEQFKTMKSYDPDKSWSPVQEP